MGKVQSWVHSRKHWVCLAWSLQTTSSSQVCRMSSLHELLEKFIKLLAYPSGVYEMWTARKPEQTIAILHNRSGIQMTWCGIIDAFCNDDFAAWLFLPVVSHIHLVRWNQNTSKQYGKSRTNEGEQLTRLSVWVAALVHWERAMDTLPTCN